jgi:hypothetical protein
MTISAGALSYVAYVAESAWATTPATPELTSLPFTSFSMNVMKDIYSDLSIRADRMERYAIHGNQRVQGDLDANFSHAVFDPLLESVLNSTFSSNILKTGTTRKSFTMELGTTDIGQYSSYTGVVVDKLALNVPVNGLVTAKFTLIGKQQTNASSSIDTTPGLTAASARQPYVHNGGTFKEGGSTVGFMTGIQMTIDNGYTTNFSLGSNYARDLSISFAKITGTVQAWFEDSIMYTKFLNETASSIDFTLTDGTNTVQVLLPNVKYTGATKTVQGQGPIVLSMPFQALYHTASSSNIVITRSA